MSRQHTYGMGHIYLRGRIWWIRYYHNGQLFRESSQSEKEADAKKLLKKRLGEIALGRFAGPKVEKVTFAELAEDFLTDYRIKTGTDRTRSSSSSGPCWLRLATTERRVYPPTVLNGTSNSGKRLGLQRLLSTENSP